MQWKRSLKACPTTRSSSSRKCWKGASRTSSIPKNTTCENRLPDHFVTLVFYCRRNRVDAYLRRVILHADLFACKVHTDGVHPVQCPYGLFDAVFTMAAGHPVDRKTYIFLRHEQFLLW